VQTCEHVYIVGGETQHWGGNGLVAGNVQYLGGYIKMYDIYDVSYEKICMLKCG